MVNNKQIQNIENKSQKLFAIKDRSLKKFLLYLTIISGFFGCAFFSYDIGPFSIFPYRIFLPVLWIFFILSLFLSQGKLNISRVKVKNYLIFFAVWLGYAILSLSWAISKTDAIRQIIFLFMGCSLSFLSVLYFNELKDLKWFYILWIVILVPLVGIGLWEVFTGNHLPISHYVNTSLPYRPSAIFYNTNNFGTYLALTVPFILSLIRYKRGLIYRIFGLIMLFLSLYLLGATLSRANYLAVFLEFAFLFIFLLKIKGKFKVAIGVGLFLFLLWFLFPKQVQKAFEVLNVQTGSLFIQAKASQGSVGLRFNIFKNSLIFLANTAGFGVGAGNAEYYLAHFAKFGAGEVATNPHNWWIEIWTNYGIWIFAGYILSYLYLLVNLYKADKSLDDGAEKMICEALLVSLVGFFFASMSSSSIMAVKPQWLLFAFALAFLNYYRLKKVKRI